MSAPTAARKNSVPLNVPKGQTPAAEGTLEQTPLLHLYVYLLDKSLTGTTVLIPAVGAAVGFVVQNGTPIRGQMRDGTLATDRTSLERALVDLCLLPADSRYGFYPRHDFFNDQEVPLIQVEPLAAIMSAARACVGSTFASATLRKVMKASTIKVAESAMPERFRLSPEERALIERLRKQSITLPELITTSGVPEQIVRGVVYGLTITRHLDFGVPARPPVGIDAIPKAVTIPAARPSNPTASSGTTGTPTSSRAKTAGTTQSGTTGPVSSEQTGPRSKPAAEPEKSGPRVMLSSEPDQHLPIRPRLNSELELIDSPQSSPVPMSYRAIELVSGEKRRTEIEAKMAKIATENHFEVLGIKENASVLEIRDAYFGMAKTFHPDRLSDMPDLRTKAQAAFAKINAAYNELSDDKKRAAYISKLQESQKDGDKTVVVGTNQATIGRAINAALEAQKAELCLKKNELAAAESHAKMASLADPEQPAYAALLAWIQAQQRPVPVLEEGKTSPVYDDLIRTFDDLLKKEPTFERALFYRATLLQRAGHADRAFKDFSRALELNPRNIDAAREVRLHQVRTKNKPQETQPEKNGGLFGKLFKR
ncbi:MAG TPA: DnaJ domain-containing protein [Polyangium sp.]|nr:DnaJ domain-containing protein [Polyangium sp.]